MKGLAAHENVLDPAEGLRSTEASAPTSASLAAQGDFVLAIDGGGSKTIAALVDRHGRIVRSARGGGVNPMDNPHWRNNLQDTLAGIGEMPAPVAIAAALPAYGEIADLSALQEESIAGIPGEGARSVLNDVDAAHLGAFAGQSGILILSGTGSMAWARDREGQSHRAGGWGDVIGDEGSAYWIGLRVLSCITKSIDGRLQPSGLVDAVFNHLGLDLRDAANALEGWATHLVHPRSEIAALAKLATHAAEQGDGVALQIVDAAATELAQHVLALRARIGSDLPWSYAGGTLASSIMRAALSDRLGAEPVPPRLPPIGGAVLSAVRLAGWVLDDGFVQTLANDLDLPSRQARDLDAASGDHSTT